METINKVPKLVLIVDHSSAGSNERFHAVYHACVESIEHLTNVAIQLRTKLTESTQENALIKPLIEHHRAHHSEIPLHINALSAELDNNLHAHFSGPVGNQVPTDFHGASPRRWTNRRNSRHF